MNEQAALEFLEEALDRGMHLPKCIALTGSNDDWARCSCGLHRALGYCPNPGWGCKCGMPPQKGVSPGPYAAFVIAGCVQCGKQATADVNGRLVCAAHK